MVWLDPTPANGTPAPGANTARAAIDGHQLRRGQRVAEEYSNRAYRCGLHPTFGCRRPFGSGCSPGDGLGETRSVRGDTGRLLSAGLDGPIRAHRSLSSAHVHPVREERCEVGPW